MSVTALSVAIPTFNNASVIAQCLESWELFASNGPVELIVVEDGCRDHTPSILEQRSSTPWGRTHLRVIHEDNVHELRATNRGFREAKAPLLMTWQDDMFLRWN
jgi:glycosyltransferase involved in cell wall biosynthesis